MRFNYMMTEQETFSLTHIYIYICIQTYIHTKNIYTYMHKKETFLYEKLFVNSVN